MGKSTLLLNQIRGDIERGAGLCVIDPHGDLADAVARSVPRHRTNDVILFDPADDDFSVGFNPLACSAPGRRDLVADDVLAAFEKVYDLENTPRLKDTLRNALYVLVEKGMTLVNLLLMLSDEAYRNRQDAMTRLALFLARLSPAAAMGHAVETMAGTDFEMHRRWRDDLIQYRGGLEAYLKEKGVTFGGFRMVVRTSTSASGGGRNTNQTLHIGGPEDESRLDLASMPQFRARPESYASALARAAPDLVIMALWAAGALLVAFARFMKYDVR